jgi:ribosomal protein S18 acetylase RimI-like enzyme
MPTPIEASAVSGFETARVSRDYRLETFGLDGVPGPAALLARLHQELLPTSPVIALGPRFLTDFYYELLPSDGLVFGAVAYVDGEPAGFIVATSDGLGFAGEGARRHWWSLGWTLAMSLAESPRRLVELWRAARLMRERPERKADDRVAEILSLGVLPKFRTLDFARTTGLRISLDLLNIVMASLRAQKATEVRAYVDADNRPAQMFYFAQGWKLTGEVPGWAVPVVEFVLHPGQS